MKVERPAAAHQVGLTIIELMTVMIIVAVVIAVATPSMRGMMARQRVQGVHTELLTDLQLARSEMAQRRGASTQVAVTFGGDAAVSCYTLHAVVAGINCDCTRGPGNACAPIPAGTTSPEIKTLQLTRAAGVSLAASSPGGTSIKFTPPQGLVSPADVVIDVQDAVSGHLRTSVSGLGVPSVCSPDSSIAGVKPC